MWAKCFIFGLKLLIYRKNATKKGNISIAFCGTDGTNKVFFNSAVIQSVGVGFAAFGGQMGDKSRFVSFYTLCRRQ